jgi:hypothetical protein
MITGQLRALCRAKRVVVPAGAVAD